MHNKGLVSVPRSEKQKPLLVRSSKTQFFFTLAAMLGTHFSVTDGHHGLSLLLASGGARSSGGAERMNT